MALVLVAAVARDRAIGKGNDLLFRIAEDQRRFRRETLGHPVVMGRKTWDSLPARFRPLPGRRNIVVTRNAQWQADGAERAASLDKALKLAGDVPKVCVIGGGELYALALPLADELVMTEVDAEVAGADTFFPEYRSQFFETERERRVTDDGLRYDFVTYQRQR
ncbi:dihydrofolate reductase [Ideonella sp. BN130291]|uniref:dihydrofolate reductase n=1 Tax=Ideonella sp. BN130291 TaxID=3112940 RepID=UPI002E26D314|nr:dihydrofolate reductase [Ideonella sp. BN130291]